MLAQEDQDEAATSSLPAGILGSFTGLKLAIIAKPALEPSGALHYPVCKL